MNFFSKSPKKPSKKTSDSDNDDTASASSRSRSPTKKSTTPASSSSSSSKPSKASREENYKHGQGSSRSSRSFVKPNTKTPRHPFDPNTHPLNLPPDQLRKLSARASSNMASDPERMDIDSEAPTSPPPQTNMPGTFDSPKTNGTPAPPSNGEGPVPPPHKSNPTSPAAASPPTAEEAEAFKAAGNKFYKAKEYKKAIEEYTKGMLLPQLNCSQGHG